MEHYKLFYPETTDVNYLKDTDLPTVYNEEKKLKKLFKDRTYKEGSTENIMISMNTVLFKNNKKQKDKN